MGGPGLRQALFDQDFYGEFAANGFRVVPYDQAGSGLSSFLPRLRDYSIAGAVEDLEAIRQELHAERMILIGFSWGSTLAASYLAKYPEHVTKVVFYSAGMIWNLAADSIDFSRTDQGTQGFPPPRLIAAMYLQSQNPAAAEKLVPQREAEELFAPFVTTSVGGGVCKGDSDKLPALMANLKTLPFNLAFNPYVMQALSEQTGNLDRDPHAALRKIATPAILLYGECNYLSWRGAIDYRKTLSNLKIYYIPRAGHFIQFEQPQSMRRVILSFLLNQTDAVPPYTDEVDPRTRQP